MSRIVRRTRAQADVRDQSHYIADHNPDAGRRYLAAVEATLDLLSRTPGVGAPRRTGNQALRGLRMHPVRGFERHLLFYCPIRGGIELVRVLHSSRDIGAVLSAEAADPSTEEEGR